VKRNMNLRVLDLKKFGWKNNDLFKIYINMTKIYFILTYQ